MDLRPIGVFDSGVGGLTAVRELRKLLPGEDILYFADTANVPYGGKDVGQLRALAAAAAEKMRGLGAKALLVACGTISSNCIGEVGKASGLPYCGVVLPASRAAAGTTKNGRVGVLSTEATARSGAFERAIKAAGEDIEVFSYGTGLLVPLAEAGRTDYSDMDVREAVNTAVEPLRDKGIDTLVLGCTHFPLLAGAISRAMEGVTLIDTGEMGAVEFASILKENGLLSGRRAGGVLTCLVSGDKRSFAQSAAIFLPEDMGSVRIENA